MHEPMTEAANAAHITDAIMALADALKVPVEFLIQHFAVLAPWEFVDLAKPLTVIAIGMAVWFVCRTRRRIEEQKDKADQDKDNLIAYIVIGTIGLILVAGGVIYAIEVLQTALKAIASPEAFAVTKILTLIH